MSEVMKGDTYIPSLKIIGTTIEKFETNVSLITVCCMLHCCCLQICNVLASEVMVGTTCTPSVIVISTTVEQLETKGSLTTIVCLRQFAGFFYKRVIFY